jgi:flagellar biosynthetic protein FliP
MKNIKSPNVGLIIIFAVILLFEDLIYAAPLPTVQLDFGSSDNPKDVVESLQILILLTVLALVPSILIMMTSFTRIVVVLSFTRSALGTQQMPPNQVIIGLALFLTIFVMYPVFSQINSNALQPYVNAQIDQQQALKNTIEPMRDFMLKQTREKDLALFVNLAKLGKLSSLSEIPTHVIIPSFMISELKTAFEMGFILFIPFLIIDMVVASTLMSMGMLMLPPVLISLPFKILLFIMVDGWNLIVRSLITSFN